jgi:hypothetical protein
MLDLPVEVLTGPPDMATFEQMVKEIRKQMKGRDK